MITHYGLIGYPLSHSFSPDYFKSKFLREGILDTEYHAYPIEDLNSLKSLIEEHNLKGLNVTIPYKEKVIPLLDEIDSAAAAVGAVNTIRIQDGILKGYNTDVIGFQASFVSFIEDTKGKALILGTGGAAKAVAYVLDTLDISYVFVSRNKPYLTYTDLRESIEDYRYIINTTPLGMYPYKETAPKISYERLNEQYFLYDLIYNPKKTLFLTKGEEAGAQIKNGLEMLYLQAEASWKIWNNNTNNE